MDETSEVIQSLQKAANNFYYIICQNQKMIVR